MKQQSIFPILILVAAAILVSCHPSQKDDGNKLSADIIPVKVAPITPGGADAAISATGLITTENEARYAFKIGGVIDKITVSEGQYFRRGQLLASLKITEVDAQLSQAALVYEKAKREHTRTRNLYRDSVATLEQLQNAKTGVDIAAKSVDAVAFNKKFAYIYAEADGFVAKKIANEGEVVGPGSPVFDINETSGTNDWTLKLGVTDREWAAISIGQKASVSIDAFPDKRFTATVLRKSQAADQSSGSFQVEMKLDVNDSRLAVGMFAKATIYPDVQKTILTIPYEALVEADGNKAFVFIPAGHQKVKRIPIIIERFTNEQVLVKSGLEEVKEVIVSNSAFLNEKSTIHIIK